MIIIAITVTLIVLKESSFDTMKFYFVILITMICTLLLVLVLYSMLITVFVSLWAIMGDFILFYLLVSLIVWCCSCGKVNFFKKCLPFIRRRQRMLNLNRI